MQVRANLHLPRDARFVAALRDSIAGLLAALQAPDGVVDDIQLALTEACSNVVRHAAGSDYHVEVGAHPGECTLRISDGGPGFTGDQGEHDLLDERGRGLLLMKILADEIDVDETRDGTVVRLVKRW